MDFRSTPCVFVGYSSSHHGYGCLDPSSDNVYISLHVRFHETNFPFLSPKPVPPTPSTSDPYISTYPSPVINEDPTPPPLSPSSTVSLPRPTTVTTPTEPTTIKIPLYLTYAWQRQRPTAPISDSSCDPPSTETHATWTRPSNLHPNPKKPAHFDPYAFHATTDQEQEPTTFSVPAKTPHWQQAMAD